MDPLAKGIGIVYYISIVAILIFWGVGSYAGG